MYTFTNMYIYFNLEIKKAVKKKTDNNMKRKFLILMSELNMLVMLLH